MTEVCDVKRSIYNPKEDFRLQIEYSFHLSMKMSRFN